MHRKLCIPGYCFCICTQIWDYRPGLDYYMSTLLVIATPLELRGHHLPPQLVVLKLCPPLALGHGLLEIKLEDLELQLSSIPPPEDVPALHFGGRTQLQVAACIAWEALKGLFQLYLFLYFSKPLFCRNHFNTHYIPNNTKTLNLKHLLQSTPSRVKLPSCVLFWILNGVSHEKLRSFVKLSPHCSKFGCLMSFCVGSNNTSIK